MGNFFKLKMSTPYQFFKCFLTTMWIFWNSYLCFSWIYYLREDFFFLSSSL